MAGSDEFTPAFERALHQVIKDFRIAGNLSSDLVAAGVERNDCLLLLEHVMEDSPARFADVDERVVVAMAVAIQWAVATGVQLERARWQ